MRIRTCMLLFIAALVAACSGSGLRDRETLNLNGRVVAPADRIPAAGSVVHVLLTEHPENTADDRVIATDSALADGRVREFDFSIAYHSDRIRETATYRLMACVTSASDVILGSSEVVRVQLPLAGKPPQLLLEEVAANGARGAEKSSSGRGTMLQRGIQATLKDICRQKSPQYDHVTRSSASHILEPEFLKGPLHSVRETVEMRGPDYFFVVDSEYGQFTAQGLAMLRKTVREIYAIQTLKQVTRTEGYLNAAGDSARIPFKEVRELVLNPVDTVSGIPGGTMKIINSTMNSLTTGRSQYEDSYAAALITVSKYKRRHAASLGVDVYSSNPLLQLELDRLGWVEALGNWTPSIALLPLSGPGVMTYQALGLTETLNRALVEQAPDALRDNNERELGRMGVPLRLRKQLLGHEYYSPRHATVLVGALATLDGVKGLEVFLQEAVKAESEIEALTFQQIAELLSGYHRSRQPIETLFVHRGLPMGYTRNGTVIVALPMDFLRWTPYGEKLVTGIDANGLDVRGRELWVTGGMTPLAESRLRELGFKVSQQVQKQVELMD